MYLGQEVERQNAGPTDFPETFVPHYQAFRRHAAQNSNAALPKKLRFVQQVVVIECTGFLFSVVAAIRRKR